MLSLRMSFVTGVAFLCTIAGCQNGKTAALRQENQELRARLADSEQALRAAPDPAMLQAMQGEIAQREARIRDLEAQLRSPGPANTAPELAGIETSYDRRKGELTVNLPADILFASGSAELKSTSKATLDKVVAALKKDYPGKAVRVEGHTDTDPIVKTRQQWQDNLDLSQSRAAAVSRYLLGAGVEKKRVATIGYGDAHPKATKSASRRVEIIVVVG
jgi:chemotaxis protein MotB